MSMLDGVFRCSPLGVDDCVVWWDAIAASASVITGLVAVIALIVAYRGVVLPYRQWMHDKVEKEDEAVMDVRYSLMGFHTFLLENKKGTLRLRKALKDGGDARKLILEMGLDCVFDVSAFPPVRSIQPLLKLRLALEKFRVGATLLNKVIDEVHSGRRDKMPDGELKSLIVRRLDDLVKYRNAFVVSANETMGIPGTPGPFDTGMEADP
ncbi:hypothetical protein [Stenotrophomonas forensis]|uniref:hypothetical protein n=1 Tax=Stenotrophomonas forensis TaxID=2871169 RepID=UPI0039C6FC0A